VADVLFEFTEKLDLVLIDVTSCGLLGKGEILLLCFGSFADSCNVPLGYVSFCLKHIAVLSNLQERDRKEY